MCTSQLKRSLSSELSDYYSLDYYCGLTSTWSNQNEFLSNSWPQLYPAGIGTEYDSNPPNYFQLFSINDLLSNNHPQT